MTKRIKTNSKLVLALFAIQVFINWAYIISIKNLFDVVITSWFLMVPLLGYFYFTFAFISSIFIYQAKRLGLVLGCSVLIFGMIATVISYNAVFKLSDIYEILIIPLIVANCFIIFLLASKMSTYEKN